MRDGVGGHNNNRRAGVGGHNNNRRAGVGGHNSNINNINAMLA